MAQEISGLLMFEFVRPRERHLIASGEVASGVPLGGHRRFTLFLEEHSCVLSALPSRLRPSVLCLSAARRVFRPVPTRPPARLARSRQRLVPTPAQQPSPRNGMGRIRPAPRPKPAAPAPPRQSMPKRPNSARARCSASATRGVHSHCAQAPSTSARRVLTMAGVGCSARAMLHVRSQAAIPVCWQFRNSAQDGRTVPKEPQLDICGRRPAWSAR